MWKSQRRQRLRSQPLLREWQQGLEGYCPFYRSLPAADQNELEGHLRVFMAEKNFEGCGGFVLSDAIKAGIAAQACLLLLHRNTDYYPDLKSVLVYPTNYVASITRHIGSGVMEESQMVRAGESWWEGVVVLAWDSVLSEVQAPENGYNVVLHEFAHQLDYEDGHADGMPLVGHGQPRSVRQQRYADWTRIMRSEYEILRRQAELGQPTFLRHYGATNAAEFFAVATENFFCRPRALQQLHPAIYEQMQWYYQQDPAQWNWPQRVDQNHAAS